MKKPAQTLERLDGRLELPSEEWANLIVVAEDWGWKPEQRRMWYLAPGTNVSAPDAAGFASALKKLLEAALTEPLSVYPIRVSMEFVYQAEEFCRRGSFRICA